MTEHYLDRLARTISENWDSPALTDFYLTDDGTAQDTSRGNHYTYGEMYQEVCRVAAMLENYGLQKGDHIAICGSNSANWVIAYLAIAKMQGVSVTIMHTLMDEEITHQVEFADCKALFVEREHWQELKQVCNPPLLTHVIALDDFLNLQGLPLKPFPHYTDTEGIAKGCVEFPHGAPDDLAMICFTSGTKGTSKGVLLSNKNISAGVQETHKKYPLRDNRNILTFLPLSHIYSFGGQFLTPIVTGASLYVMRDVINWLPYAIRVVHPYALYLVPILITMLKKLSINTFEQIASDLDYFVIGCAQLPNDTEDYLLQHNIPLCIGYGLTETTGPICLSPKNQHKIRSCGKLLFTLEARLSSEGEILVRGENVMLGYYKNPEATAEKIDAEGWLHTGDAGYIDEDGYLYVTGRIGQDMIVLPNGENIHPEDIERKLDALSEVAESLVLARDGKLVALVRLEISQNNRSILSTPKEVQQSILRKINPLLPMFSQITSVEFLTEPLQRTAKQTIKRYLYK